MSSSKLVVQGAAGALGGAGLDVSEVFSTYLYAGNSSTQTITNGIDLSTEGGLVWTKTRNEAAYQHWLFDTERGVNKYLFSALTNAEGTLSNGVTSFNSDGFTVGAYSGNETGDDIVSWTFRKAPKFFDVVTYTGDGTNGKNISHNLGSVPGCIMIKNLTTARSWAVYHRGMDATAPEDYYMSLDLTNARANTDTRFNDTAPTDSQFTVGGNSSVNTSGNNYVAYLFAHNDGDGEFGPDGDADIIKCGSYTGNGSSGTSGPSIDLGFEPQWVMIKRANNDTGDWKIFDAMRGVATGGTTNLLEPNTSDAEVANNDIDFDANGFNVINSNARINASGSTYIYIAIRRGPMAVPEDATDVFAIQDGRLSTVPQFESGFAVDMAINRYLPSSSNPHEINARLTGNQTLNTSSTSSEVTRTNVSFDFMDGYYEQATPATADHIAWMWRRAPNYFDVVCFEGTGATAQTINHNLGAVPEMMWLKRRDAAQAWQVYHSGLNSGTSPEDYYLILNTNSDEANSNLRWNDTAPTETQFTVNGGIASNGAHFVMYLFASLNGISKVSWYTGTGADGNNIDCGFSSGARFVLIKRVDQNENWVVYDTERGIVAGNDPYLLLNSTAAETTGTDYIDPYSSGFAVNNNALVNASGGRYVFYAIA